MGWSISYNYALGMQHTINDLSTRARRTGPTMHSSVMRQAIARGQMDIIYQRRR